MSNATGREGENADIKENFYKVKNVFDILISEASYLVDDKAYQVCADKPQKEQFLIMIDSIRKSLGIDSMEDVELLVETFYSYGEKKRERLKEEEAKRLEAKENDQQSNPGQAPPPVPAKDKKAGEKGGKNDKNGAQEEKNYDDIPEEEKDPTMPDIEMDDVCDVLQDFHNRREEKLNNQDTALNPSLKKKSNFLSEEE